ncbi:hypothetical protein C1701_07675 [Actinoalloteichus sp. AHMU CJ021]|uniref:YeeE/YedE family protein n=1 Tax=Actinoalloteichus sp. AHMU CJ021 TaxID=2072503 RepID=UPI000CA026F4|nr:hypothetical protein C1701_07675 [Actinoalloteichus sp. AHMU CJ021]
MSATPADTGEPETGAGHPPAHRLGGPLIAPTSHIRPAPPEAPPVRTAPLVVAGLLALALSWHVWLAHGAQQATLLVIGLGLGVTLFHSRFGFTSAWRQLVSVGNGSGLRAHALLIGTTATLVTLLIGTGTGLFGTTPSAAAGDIGLPLFLGAFLFGLGMQLGGACASGTLFAVGSGQSTIVLTLGGFVAGSVLYTWQYGWFDSLPTVPGVLLSDHVGWFGSWLVTLTALGLVVLVSVAVQRRRDPPPVGAVPTARGAARVLRGSWPMLVGAVVLAVLAAAVLLVSGGTWGVTNAFGLWGAKLLQVLGAQPEQWAFWQEPGNAEMLASPVLAHKNSLTNIGIMVGAAIAAGAAGAWRLHRHIPWRTALAAVLGGVIMGVGARLASGCNIGAYLGGISTGSVSGWLWAVAALVGTWVGLRLRPLFGLANPRPSDGAC